jgi:hypothetical protein
MSTNIIEQYGQNSINEFWIFVDQLGFDCSHQDAEAVRVSLLKQISPGVASKYKQICDELAQELYTVVSKKKESSYLYASYEAIARGKEFYTVCKDNINTIAPLLESVRTLNHFGNVFPTDDDYYGKAPTYIIEENYYDDGYED